VKSEEGKLKVKLKNGKIAPEG